MSAFSIIWRFAAATLAAFGSGYALAADRPWGWGAVATVSFMLSGVLRATEAVDQ